MEQYRNFSRLAFAFALAGLAVGPGPEARPADVIRVEPRETWSGYFGGQDIDLKFRIAQNGERPLRIGWTARIQKQVVARRDLTIAGKSGEAAEFNIPLRLPDAEPRAILPALVTISIEGQEILERPLWIFPRDPFVDRKKALSALPISLFDPERKTAVLFENAGIAVHEVRQVESLDDVTGGLIVIGEGISFRDYRGLPARMLAAAARGNHVLCLAPAAGAIELTGADGTAGGAALALSLRRGDVIGEFDKRLDARAWPTDGKVIAASVTLIGERGPVSAEVIRNDQGWPWLEVEYSRGGRFILCGFAFADHWDSGPAPRYVFKHLLNRATMKNIKP
jgi:hypothetical protein